MERRILSCYRVQCPHCSKFLYFDEEVIVPAYITCSFCGYRWERL